MAAITITTTGRVMAAGTDLAAIAQAAAAGGDYLQNSGAELTYFSNASVGDITLTIAFASTGTVDGVAPTNKALTLTAGERYILGPWPTNFYNDASGRVQFTYSGVTSLTVAALLPTTS